MPSTATAMPQTKIRHARVHGRFLDTTRSADFHAMMIAAIEMIPETTFSKDHGHGPTTTCTLTSCVGGPHPVEHRSACMKEWGRVKGVFGVLRGRVGA